MAKSLAEAELALTNQDPAEALRLAKDAKIADSAVAIPALDVIVSAQVALEDGQEALISAKEMLKTAKDIGNTEGEAKACLAVASAYLFQETTMDAMEMAEKAKSIYLDLKNMKGQANALTMAAKIYVAMEKAQAALDAAGEAVSLWRDAGDTKGLAGALEVLVQAYAMQMNPMAGLKAANRELSTLKAAGNVIGQANILEMIANTHATLGEPYGALKAAEAARILYEGSGNTLGQACMLHVESEMLRSQGNKSGATAKAEKALKICKTQKYKGLEEQVLETLSYLLVEIGYPEKAPKRKDAIKVLKDMVQAIHMEDAVALKDAEEKVNKVSQLLTDQDYVDVLHSELHANPKAVAFLESQGWQFKRETTPGACSIKVYPHRAFYLHTCMTGMGFGPQFRSVNPFRVNPNPKAANPTPIGISCSNLAETEAWQMELGYRPGILDSGLQVQAVNGFPQ